MSQRALALSVASSLIVTFVGPAAHADEPPPAPPATEAAPPLVAPHESGAPKQYPALGGHFGFALPIVIVSGKTTAIGADFVTLGLTPGITVHLDDKWSVDFEFIAFNELKNTPAKTTFVVDPGVTRKFEGFTAGLRIATEVGAPTNGALVPIVVVPFKISDALVYFFEGDIPVFLRDGGTKVEGSATFLFQSGFGF